MTTTVKKGDRPHFQTTTTKMGTVPLFHGPHFSPLLTYKGPKKAGLSLKVRREVQTYVEDARAMTQLLAALGFAPTAVVRKRRSSYRVGLCQVELDELRGVGRFVEVEGPSRRQVEAVCKQLDLQGERVTRSYVSMVTTPEST